MRPKVVSIDFETYCDLDIKKVGGHRYTSHESFEIILAAVSFDYKEPILFDLVSSNRDRNAFKQMLADYIIDKEIVKTSWNVPFEFNSILNHYKKYPTIVNQMNFDEWSDTMDLAALVGLPLGLGMAADALNVEMKKDTRGTRLITKFCKPNKKGIRTMPEDAPEDWEDFKEYNLQDVRAENAVRKKIISERGVIRAYNFERAIRDTDFRINQRGVKVDPELVRGALVLNDTYSKGIFSEAQQISGLENPGSRVQALRFVNENEGLELDSLRAEVLGELLEVVQKDSTKRFLEIYKDLQKTSIAKYRTIEAAVCDDGHIRGLFQYYGARTGRWAGRLVQLQNLPANSFNKLGSLHDVVKAVGKNQLTSQRGLEVVHKGYVEKTGKGLSSAMSELIRTSLIPTKSPILSVADYSAIEARVLSWLAWEKWRLDVFAGDGRIYEATASKLFGVPDRDVTKELRAAGKVAELASGYGGGIGAYKNFGMDSLGYSDDEIQNLINIWRSNNPKIVNFWYEIDRTAKSTILSGEPSFLKVGKDGETPIRFEFVHNHLLIILPVGRSLVYRNAKVEIGGRFNNEIISYEGMNSYTHKWTRLETYGGKLTENVTQAIARDLLAISLVNLDKAGFDVVAHVHDEIIADTSDLAGMVKIMEVAPEWCKSMPLRADGYQAEYYYKD